MWIYDFPALNAQRAHKIIFAKKKILLRLILTDIKHKYFLSSNIWIEIVRNFLSHKTKVYSD